MTAPAERTGGGDRAIRGAGQPARGPGRRGGQGAAGRAPAALIVAVEVWPSVLIQASWWLAPATRASPLAIAPTGTRLLAVCARAAQAGCAPGQTVAQARLRCPDLVVRPPDEEALAWLWDQALLALTDISPVVEETSAHQSVVFLDARGLERLWGDPAAVGRAALDALRECGLCARAGVGPSRVVALACARRMGAAGPQVLMDVEAQSFLAALPLDDPALGLPLPIAALLREVGVATAGALAALPAASLALRFGPEGVAAGRRARGDPELPLQPWRAAPVLLVEEQCADGVADMLLLHALFDRLSRHLEAALAARGQAMARCILVLECDDGTRHVHTTAAWPPLAAASDLSRTLQMVLAQHPPPAPVTHIALQARDLGALGAEQRGLWTGQAEGRRQERLAATLAAHSRRDGGARLQRLLRDPLSPEGWRWEEMSEGP